MIITMLTIAIQFFIRESTRIARGQRSGGGGDSLGAVALEIEVEAKLSSLLEQVKVNFRLRSLQSC